MPQAINLEGLSLDKFLEHHVATSGWVLEKGHGRGQLIVLPRNEFNHPELKKTTDDGIPLEHVARIFPILGWSSFLPISIAMDFVLIFPAPALDSKTD